MSEKLKEVSYRKVYQDSINSSHQQHYNIQRFYDYFYMESILSLYSKLKGQALKISVDQKI